MITPVIAVCEPQDERRTGTPVPLTADLLILGESKPCWGDRAVSPSGDVRNDLWMTFDS